MDFYKNKVTTEFKVGIFTLVGILILFLSYAWFTEYINKNKYTEIVVRFTNAGNIEKGSDVTIMGVKSGKVSDLRIERNSVILILKVLLKDPLFEETDFIINEVDLMGDVQVEIKPGTGNKLLDLSAVHQGKRKPGMASLISEMSEVVMDLKIVIRELNKNDGMLNTGRSIMDSSLIFVTELKDFFQNNSENLAELTVKSAEVVSQLAEIINRNETNINQGFDSMVKIMAEINLTLEELNKTSQSVRNLTEKVSTDSSTVNRLLSEEDLYFTLQKTVARMDSLLLDIKENPKKYFKFSVF
jgi:phospholipid/cholesterol/gamma-HCH transport system substrate-binding protein